MTDQSQHEARMARANEQFMLALAGMATPDKLCWRQPDTTMRQDPDSPSHEIQARRAEEHKMARQDIEDRAVSRDPCWHCGVRGDIGCEC